MNKTNFWSNFKSIKDKYTNEFSFNLITKVLPISLISFVSYYVYRYELYNMFRKEKRIFTFTKAEEKQIAKKLGMLLKYKNIEKLYEEKDKEVVLTSRIYSLILSTLKLNYKKEVYVIKSDLIFLNVLSTGSLFVSDV